MLCFKVRRHEFVVMTPDPFCFQHDRPSLIRTDIPADTGKRFSYNHLAYHLFILCNNKSNWCLYVSNSSNALSSPSWCAFFANWFMLFDIPTMFLTNCRSSSFIFAMT